MVLGYRPLTRLFRSGWVADAGREPPESTATEPRPIDAWGAVQYPSQDLLLFVAGLVVADTALQRLAGALSEGLEIPRAPSGNGSLYSFGLRQEMPCSPAVGIGQFLEFGRQ